MRMKFKVKDLIKIKINLKSVKLRLLLQEALVTINKGDLEAAIKREVRIKRGL